MKIKNIQTKNFNTNFKYKHKLIKMKNNNINKLNYINKILISINHNNISLILIITKQMDIIIYIILN